MTVRLACSFDVSLFPFDKHLCPIDVGSWLSTNDTYKIRCRNSHFKKSHFAKEKVVSWEYLCMQFFLNKGSSDFYL